MYFWNTKKLEIELINQSLSQKDKFKYLLAFMILTTFAVESSLYLSEKPSILMLCESLLVFLFNVLGTIYCFKVNSQGDDIEFIERYICLSLPIFFRIFAYFLVVFTAYMITGFIIFGDLFDSFIDQTNWVDVIFAVGSELAFYLLLASSFRRVAIIK